MSTERLTMLITVLTIATQSGLYLITGGFSIGSKVSDMGAEIKLLRSEIVAQNEIQNYRLDELEGAKTANSSSEN
ncbi:hypothetical protein [Anabaena lutea]|uniref:TMhelix containing protein n=1 Tax=Anabaena lutea FACHB-196 TaxID=2692881 RepID=A0ABR8FHW1_9NOST|nr:hypothetical protein [Anabaena lutea]MBD2569689.1 hypothetical protein [Anabaena lutea FACHB-196]